MLRKLYLSDTDKKLAGVCGGLGEYFNVDPTLIRLLWILLTFFNGIGLFSYFIAWLIMPRKSFSSSNPY
ncbi:MAG: PspC domain-containing protein [Clostridia bacterium]|nr:PspC domain-containing protein [Clostridia bacterium]